MTSEIQLIQKPLGQEKWEGLLRNKWPFSFLVHMKSKFWWYFSTSKYDLSKILLIFSRMVYFYLHQGQHLKPILDNICPVRAKKMKYFAVTLNTLTESHMYFFTAIRKYHWSTGLFITDLSLSYSYAKIRVVLQKRSFLNSKIQFP